MALVDDNGPDLAALAALVDSELQRAGQSRAEIVTFSSGEEFLAAWQPGGYDAVILDIFMDGIDGVEVARRIRRTDAEVALVFYTSSNEFAAESYEVTARYYLRKPVTARSVATMLRRLELDELERRRMVTLPDGQQAPLRSIVFTEYYNHVVTVYLSPASDGRASTLRVRTSQAQMEELLLAYDNFLAPSRGIIVNLLAVEHMNQEDLILRGGRIVHIARRKYKEVRAAYNNFRLQLLRGEAGT